MSCEHEGIIINPPAPTPSGGGGMTIQTTATDDGYTDSQYTGTQIWEAVQNGIVPVLLVFSNEDHEYVSAYHMHDADTEVACFVHIQSGHTLCVDPDGHIYADE